MPDAHADPMAAFQWLLPALEKDLKESKMWPIRLAQHKHQEKLRFLGLIASGTMSLGMDLRDIYVSNFCIPLVSKEISLPNIRQQSNRSTSSFSHTNPSRTGSNDCNQQFYVLYLHAFNHIKSLVGG